ncbi:MAG: glycosyltransferase family 4 protein [Sulfuritalea sp.]|nr:glycosyltransferase family 4 protein [Sulfuritalea sp.]
MNVLHFSTSDIEGGSARSAWRIHGGLKRSGVGSRMLVGSKSSNDPSVAAVAGDGWLQRADTVSNIILQKLGLQYLYVPSSARLARHPWVQEADLFQLFNTHGGYFALDTLARLGRRAPIVWRLSDLWPLTGHCAYPGDCVRWMDGCGQCPDLDAYPPIGRDTTAQLWRRKRVSYDQCDITVIAPSSWTEAAARCSPLLAGRPVHRVPNGIDHAVFTPRGRQEARARLGIADERLAILFAAHIAFDNPRKGSDLLLEALRMLGRREDVFLLVAGRNAERWRSQVPIDVVPLGYMEGDELLADVYSAADVVCVPSAVENLPNIVLEAMACGTPVVAIDAGGMRDAVRDGDTGLLRPPGDPAAFATALARMLDDPEARRAMAGRALKMIRNEFTVEGEIARIRGIYEGILARREA